MKYLVTGQYVTLNKIIGQCSFAVIADSEIDVTVSVKQKPNCRF